MSRPESRIEWGWTSSKSDDSLLKKDSSVEDFDFIVVGMTCPILDIVVEWPVWRQGTISDWQPPILTNCWCRLNSLNQLVGCGGSSGRALDLISKSCKFKSHPELYCSLWFHSSKNYCTMALWHCTMVWMTSKCQVLESYNLLMNIAVKSYS